MSNARSAPGCLTEVEASHLLTQAIPGAIVVHLKREMGNAPGRRMFIELNLEEAVQHWRHMGELIRKAGALEREAQRVDAVGPAR